jgi:hypothetical protein
MTKNSPKWRNFALSGLLTFAESVDTKFTFSSKFSSSRDRDKQLTWRRGVVTIVSAKGIEVREFESRRGVLFLGVYTLQCCSK